MDDFIRGLWLSGVGMAATIVICSAVIGLVWLLRRLVEGMSQRRETGTMADGRPEPPLPMLAGAVAAMMDGQPYRIWSVRESDSSWARAGREDLARTEGGSW